MKEGTETAEASLAEFIRQAWDIVEPGVDYVYNWHIGAICDHLEAVVRGEIKDLLINVPPGTMKSLACCVFFPTWVWISNPSARFLFASYGQDLATRDSVKCRAIIESEWYQSRWGDRVKIVSDQNQKTKFDTVARGWRMATSVGGRATGEHPDFVIVDDPHTAAQAESDTMRQAALDWWDSTISTRGRSRGARRVVIMQRLHEDDLTGHLLQADGWERICIPMRYEAGRMEDTSIGWNDPRSEAGDLMWPEMFDDASVKKMEADLRPHRASGQLQQRPSAPQGEFFRREWFRLASEEDLPDDLEVSGRAVRYWDKAGTEGGGDFTAGVLIVEHDGTWYVMDVARGRWSAGRRNGVMRSVSEDDAKRFADYSVWVEQEPGSGGKESAEYTVRDLSGFNVRKERVTGSKSTRAAPWSAQLDAGNVRVLRASWTRAFIDEHAAFPNGRNDDQVDAAAGAFAKLTRSSSVRDWVDAGAF